MYFFSFFLLFTTFNLSIANQDPTDLGVFNVDESDTPIVLDPNFNSDLVAGIDPGEGLSDQDPDHSLDLYPPQLSVDGSIFDGLNTDLLAEGCSSTNTLEKKRDGGLECSTNEFKAPEILNFDQIIDKIAPAGSTKQEPNGEVDVPNGLLAIDKAKCPRDRPYYLCCICDANFVFLVCQDCLVVSALRDGCFSPYMEVCCELFGVYIEPFDEAGRTNLDLWIEVWAPIYHTQFDTRLNYQGGTLGEFCKDAPHLGGMPR